MPPSPPHPGWTRRPPLSIPMCARPRAPTERETQQRLFTMTMGTATTTACSSRLLRCRGHPGYAPHPSSLRRAPVSALAATSLRQGGMYGPRRPHRGYPNPRSHTGPCAPPQ
ncbi:hypothetical protein BJ912DRAFT_1067238 [Pholiota molesta]|nr:hypothetical protein BJ912DRAFT_1067238 [Pholiota molesta]